MATRRKRSLRARAQAAACRAVTGLMGSVAVAVNDAGHEGSLAHMLLSMAEVAARPPFGNQGEITRDAISAIPMIAPKLVSGGVRIGGASLPPARSASFPPDVIRRRSGSRRGEQEGGSRRGPADPTAPPAGFVLPSSEDDAGACGGAMLVSVHSTAVPSDATLCTTIARLVTHVKSTKTTECIKPTQKRLVWCALDFAMTAPPAAMS